MAKSANLYARIEPEVKEQAESILAALGIPASNAITMFYKQISRMTAVQLDAELEKGYADMLAGRALPLETAFAQIRKESGV